MAVYSLPNVRNIRKLGRIEFAEYRESVAVDSEDNPWREQTKCRAERIANLAKLCLDGRKNEAGWRMSLESEILARFTIEVACRKCRARLWRSELEAAASSLDRFLESLEERQKKRLPCTCRLRRRGPDA
jgi:post-segregation antitoxin (ccd killing protein)